MRCKFTDLMLNKYSDWNAVQRRLEYNSQDIVDGVQAVDWFFDPTPDNSWDDCHDQGHEGVVYMVFKFENRFWKVKGKSDSYGTTYWGAGVTEVFPNRVVKTIYEYTEKKEN